MSSHSYADALGNSFLVEKQWWQRVLYQAKHSKTQTSEEKVTIIKSFIHRIMAKIGSW